MIGAETFGQTARQSWRIGPKWARLKINGSDFPGCPKAWPGQFKRLTWACTLSQNRLTYWPIGVTDPMAVQSNKTFLYAFIVVLAFALSGIAVFTSVVGSAAEADEETSIAKSLAAMVNAALAVISKHQDHIDDASIGNKGVDGKTVLTQAQQFLDRKSTRLNSS